MYIIKLDSRKGHMFQALYNYQGFKATLKLEEATKFKTSEAAYNMLEAMSGIRQKYNEAQIEKIK